MDTIGSRVKAVREDKDYTQKAFGKKISVGQTYLSQIENDERPVTEKLKKIICYEFNVSRAWLEDGIGDMYNNMDIDLLNKVDEIISGEDEFYKNLLRTIVNLSDEDLLLFKKMVDNLTKKS